MNKTSRLAYIWDYDIDETTLRDILSGKSVSGKLDKNWAALRIFEYAPYSEVVRLLGYHGIVEYWPGLRKNIRSGSRRRGFDFLVGWLKEEHPEKL